jgi:hypothetical protein
MLLFDTVCSFFCLRLLLNYSRRIVECRWSYDLKVGLRSKMHVVSME